MNEGRVSARKRMWGITAICATALTACSTASSATPGAAGQTNTQLVSALHAPDVAITPADKSATVAPSTQVTVTASGGTLSSVVVTQAGVTAPLTGDMSADHHTWLANVGLFPDSSYTVKASAVGTDGSATDDTSSFTTTGGQRLVTQALPGDGATVGVGMPIKLQFNTPIPQDLEAALVSHVHIKSTPAVQGDWHWFSATEVHWRPAVYWPAGTQVTIDAELQGVNAGNDYWGYANWTSSFTVGEKHVTMIDHNTETMQVYTNDVLVNTIPVSLGKSGFPTISGTLVVWYKSQKVMMDSCASGIDCTPGTTNYYKEYVYWDTAISTDGFFIHDAYWDIPAQGHYDFSHGCVNINPQAAQWFYGYSIPGDVVVIANTARAADSGDGEGDWQIPFAQWPNSTGSAPATVSTTGA